MKKQLLIIGAGGHGKVVADIAERMGYTSIAFLDSGEKREWASYPVVGKESMVNELDGDVIIAIGNAAARCRLQETIDKSRITTLIHPDSVIARDVEIGAGTVVMAGTVINAGTRIGRGCIINTCASVDHDCEIGNYAHVSVGAHIAGGVSVEDNTWIGVGAAVRDHLQIAGNCMIGAGAVVVKSIDSSGTYIGVPASKV